VLGVDLENRCVYVLVSEIFEILEARAYAL